MTEQVYIAINNNINEACELAAFAHVIADANNAPVLAIMPSCGISEEACFFSEQTGVDLIVLSGTHLKQYSQEGFSSAIADFIADKPCSCVIFSHNAAGIGSAAFAAASLGMELVTGVEQVLMNNGSMVFRRSIFNGKVIEEIKPRNRSFIVTVMPGAFFLSDDLPQSPGKIEIHETPISLSHTVSSFLSVSQAQALDSGLKEADVIVGIGRGAEKAFNEGLVSSLASLFSRSAVGASRAACDRGLMGYGAQIGITGMKVSPKLYIACGISGSTQHLAGIKGAGCIAAVNRDPAAPVFRQADIGFVDELENFIPELLKAAEGAE